MSAMDEEQRLKLKEMIKANDAKDYTEKIRTLKHSRLIKEDVDAYYALCKKYPNSQTKEFFKKACMNKCQFMLTNYTDIYNKLTKNELNPLILYKFLDVLRDIEDGKLDQHEGSYRVGMVLKELYVDAALKKGEKLDRAAAAKNKPQKQPKKISYAQFKAKQAAVPGAGSPQ